MNLNQRKSELIEWISAIESESVLIQLQDLKKKYNKEDFPSKILELLHLSDAHDSSSLIKHTNVRDILKS